MLKTFSLKIKDFYQIGNLLTPLTLLPIKNGNVRIVSFNLNLQRLCDGFESDSSKD